MNAIDGRAALAVRARRHPRAAAQTTPPTRTPGTRSAPWTSPSPARAAPAEFDRAVALLHHMTYPRARMRSRRWRRKDPQCAMAHWGIAMTLFQPLWPTRPVAGRSCGTGGRRCGQARRSAPPTERERRFVAAAEAFFLEPDVDRLLAAHPPLGGGDRGGVRRVPRRRRCRRLLCSGAPRGRADRYQLARQRRPSRRASSSRSTSGIPDHPGAMHYLVHANDMPGRERESLEITRKYEASAPRNPHALHMPTHIYTRLGDWDGVIRGNLRAAEAALEHPAGEQRRARLGRVPPRDRVSGLRVSAEGRGRRGRRAGASGCAGPRALEPTFKTAFHLASTPARYALERRAWREAAALVPREPATLDWDRFAWPEAIARFARGPRRRASRRSRRGAGRPTSGSSSSKAADAQGRRGAVRAQHRRARAGADRVDRARRRGRRDRRRD